MSPQSVAAAAADFKKRIRGIFRIPEPAERTKQFQVLLDGMDNARLEATAWLIFERESLGDEVTGLWEQLFDHWGRGDFQAAIAFARHNGRPEGRRINYRLAQSRALTAQAEINPEAARRYIESPDCQYDPQMEGPNKGDSDKEECLVKGWSLSDPKAAAEWHSRQPTSPHSARSVDCSHMLVVTLTTKYGPEETTAWFDSLDTAVCHPRALTYMGDALYMVKRDFDPGVAEAWIMTKLGSAWFRDSKAIHIVVHTMAERDPVAAMSFAERFQNEFAIILGFREFTRQDAAAASEWLRSHGDHFAYDSLASSLAMDLLQTPSGTDDSEEKFAAALPWAQSISDPVTRAQAIEEVREAAVAWKARE